MNGRVSKTRTRQPRLKLSRASEGKLVDAVTKARTVLPPSSRERSPVNGDLARDTPSQTKRQRDESPEADQLPTKRARLTGTDTQRPQVADERAERVDKTPQQQSRPKPKYPSTSPSESKVEKKEQVFPATVLQKRRFGSDRDDNEHKTKRARLTRKNLALFNEMVKKGTNKASASASASAVPESTVESSTTKTTSTTTSGFAIQARKNGMLDPLHSKPPTNLQDYYERYAQSRRTASPTEPAYEGYANNVGKAPNEATMVFEVGSQLLKGYDDKGYNRVFNQAFTAFPKDVGFNNGLSAPQPDFVEGLEMEEYLPFPVDEYVSGAVLYKDNPNSLTLPHLAGEWKGSGKDMEKARLQSRYDGAALVYARNQVLSYLGKPDPPGHAEVTTFTTDGTNLNFYAHYATPSEDGTLEYHQYQYASANVKDSHQGHNDGRRGLRNEQDHARKQSCALRDQLKEHWKQRRSALQPIAEEAPLPVPVIEPPVARNAYADDDEDGDVYEVVEQPCEPTPPTSSKLECLSKHSNTPSSCSSSSRSLPPASGYGGGSGAQKRKASLSEGSSHKSSRQRSKGRDYWERDAKSGRYFHEHSDGTITWEDGYNDGR